MEKFMEIFIPIWFGIVAVIAIAWFSFLGWLAFQILTHTEEIGAFMKAVVG